MIKLVVVGLLEGVEAFADDHVAGGAGAREFARMLDLDAVRKERAGQVLTRSSLKDEPSGQSVSWGSTITSAFHHPLQ